MKRNSFDYPTASITLINYGVATGWSSPSIDLLTSDKSPLPSGKITMDEASWVASALAIGALPGNVLYGFLIKKIGRKWPLILSFILRCLTCIQFMATINFILYELCVELRVKHRVDN